MTQNLLLVKTILGGGLKLNKLKLDFFITPTSLPKTPIKKRFLS